MCRGCRINIESSPSVDRYLEIIDTHTAIISKMKALEKTILIYENDLDEESQRKIFSKFRRKLIRLRKEYGRAENALNEI
jgi:hypothetical protein